jgi:hypothetical protein
LECRYTVKFVTGGVKNYAPPKRSMRIGVTGIAVMPENEALGKVYIFYWVEHTIWWLY